MLLTLLTRRASMAEREGSPWMHFWSVQVKTAMKNFYED